jgi:hypothetical protein
MVYFRRIAPHTFKYSGASLCCGSTTLLCTVWRAFLLKHTIAPISNDVAPAPWRKNDAALYPALPYFSAYTQYTAGFWIRIDSIRIRILIQKFRLIQKQIWIWIHKVSESAPESHSIRIKSGSGYGSGSTTLVYSIIKVLKFIHISCGSAAAAAPTRKLMQLLHWLRLCNNRICRRNSTSSKLCSTSFEIVRIIYKDLDVQNSENFTFLLISGSGSTSSIENDVALAPKQSESFEIVRSYKAIIVRRSIMYMTIRSKKYNVRNSKTKPKIKKLKNWNSF